jgi:predicted RNA methylase
MRLTVHGIPPWVDAHRLLGPEFSRGDGWSADLPVAAAAAIAARLRGVGLNGHKLELRGELPRAAVRAARTDDARRRRASTPGFERSGALLDAEGKISLTPERLAMAIAKNPPATVVDAGCGCGGNAIAFARRGATVIAVERDAERLRMARHNAQVYGVASRIRFIHGDAVDHLADAELCFVDPPWGADWNRERTDASEFPLLEAIRASMRPYLAKLPPSFDTSSTPEATPTAWFGLAEGDFRRVKFITLRRQPEATTALCAATTPAQR